MSKFPAYPAIQRALLDAIAQPHFNAALPPLSDEAWASILETSRDATEENDRLEFMGDALMYATLGRQLYRQLPNGTPDLYSNVRSALHSNATFSRLAEKLDIFAVSGKVLTALTAKTFGEGTSAPFKSWPQVKATADLFETVIAVYYMERGFETLCDWVNELYRPLILVAKQAYLEYRRTHPRPSYHSNGRPPWFTQRPRLHSPMRPVLVYPHRSVLNPRRSTLSNKSRRHEVPVTPHRVIMPRRQVPAVRAPAPAYTPASRSKASPVWIDLTEEDDGNDSIMILTPPLRPFPPPPTLGPIGNIPGPLLLSAGSSAAMMDDDSNSSSTDELLLESMLITDDMDSDSIYGG